MNVQSPIAAAALALSGACASPPSELPEPTTPAAAAQAAADPRIGAEIESGFRATPGTTLADRARWFALLRWPEPCERAFDLTRGGSDGGVEIHDLTDGSSIALVRCAAGAYQPTSVVMRFRRERPEATAALLELPFYRSPYGRELVQGHTTEITGETSWLADQQSLVLLSLSRQTADCGIWTRYSLAGGEPRITGLAVRLPCPEGAELPVEADGDVPPADWRMIAPD
ncbi:MAG: hypothetical protein KDH17_01460 [Rhodocyclaceae bacterium]|nr:hypothetical protein [Rhodocyclaceae bacterium]